jgi:hypothetical protein
MRSTSIEHERSALFDLSHRENKVTGARTGSSSRAPKTERGGIGEEKENVTPDLTLENIYDRDSVGDRAELSRVNQNISGVSC